jgi:DHA1 family bicyclomycin/chloramphenicol resistance-like MFS transporter
LVVAASAGEDVAMHVGRMSYREYVAFLATVSMTIAMAIDVMLPALSEMKESLGLAPESNSIALTVTLYFLGMSVTQLVYGPLSDHFGRKPILYTGLAVYGFGAVLSAAAPNLTVLLVARFVWGVGAAAMRVLSNAMARDVFEGDAMARVLALVISVFLLGPVFAPLLGEGLLQLGSWRWVFAGGAGTGLAVFVWSFRLEETLAPEHRLPLGFNRTAQAFRAVLTTHETLWYSIAQVFGYGNLLMYLASSELLFDVVYDRSDQFAVAFSLAGIASATVAFTNSRIVERMGTARLLRIGAFAAVALAGALAALSIASEGVPPFHLWWLLVALVMATFSILVPTTNALAMQPMGHLAGTAAAVVGTFSMGGGSILGAIVDRTLSTSVTPQAIGFFVFTTASLAAVLIADRGPSVTAEPASEVV